MSPRTKLRSIQDLCDFSNGHGFGPTTWAKKGLPIIRIQNLNGSNEFNYFDGEAQPDWIVEPGALLFAWAGTRGVSFGPTIWKGPRGVLNQHIYRVHPKEGVDLVWLYSALKVVTARIERKAHGFKSTLLHVGKNDIIDQVVATPAFEEQQRTAGILGTWDAALEKFDALIAAKANRKQALMQQLLAAASQKTRHGHARHRLGEVVERVTRKNTEGNDNVLTISAQDGLINQREYFNRSVAGADLSGYFLLRRGEFAYNRSSSIGFPYGAIKRLDRYEVGVVSTLYLCFRLQDKGAVSSDYLAHYLDRGFLNSGLRSVAKEGARAHGLLNITADEFLDIDIFLPSLHLQTKIAAVLNAADKELRLLRDQRAAVDQQKRGLMQQLLTGKIRVKVA